MWTIESVHCKSNYTANEGSSSTYTCEMSMMNAGDKFIVSYVKYSTEKYMQYQPLYSLFKNCL